MDDIEFWNLKFSTEVSARYHDWRRTTLWTIVRFTRVLILSSVVVTLVTAFIPLLTPASVQAASWWTSLIIALFSILIGVITLFDLTENFTGKAQRHENLYRRFKELQAKIERHRNELEKYIAEWQSEAQLIRIDEPPTLWAIYARSWNQTIEQYALEKKGYYRKVSTWQRLLGGLIHFNPQDFPAVQQLSNSVRA